MDGISCLLPSKEPVVSLSCEEDIAGQTVILQVNDESLHLSFPCNLAIESQGKGFK